MQDNVRLLGYKAKGQQPAQRMNGGVGREIRGSAAGFWFSYGELYLPDKGAREESSPSSDSQETRRVLSI